MKETAKETMKETMKEMVDPETKRKIVGILSVLFPEAKIYLFGSRATGKARDTSDIDIALDAGEPLAWVRTGEARSMFAESNIIQSIDIVDLNEVPENMRQMILKEGILWKS